ncbi:MAG: hypothetical protein JWR08_1685, partial [Enterovirga sp.]|nr:hypothetical protein [Enterovirga sp.]
MSDAASLPAPGGARLAGGPGPAGVRFRGGGFLPRTSRLVALVAFVLAVAIWQAAVSLGWV